VEAKSMANGLLDKLTNFLMPLEETALPAEVGQSTNERRSQLRLHTIPEPIALKFVVCSPITFDDVCLYADYLKFNAAVIINFAGVDMILQQRISDFLNGVCCVTGGAVQRISDYMTIYVPQNVTVSKELYAYSIPAYGKSPTDF
jgi:cell division inhibitor SepF